MKGEELGRERGSRGGVCAREKTTPSEAMIWLLVLSSGEGKEEHNDMETEQEKNGRERKRESSAFGWSVILVVLSPTLLQFLHQVPTHKTVIFQTSRFKKAGTKHYSVTSHQCFYINAMQL